MKATELAEIIYCLDCWGLGNDYAIEKVITPITTKRFSNLLEEKKLPAGLYLWMTLTKSEHDSFMEFLKLTLGADFKPFFDQKGVSLYYIVIKID